MVFGFFINRTLYLNPKLSTSLYPLGGWNTKVFLRRKLILLSSLLLDGHRQAKPFYVRLAYLSLNSYCTLRKKFIESCDWSLSGLAV
jgi:hypothetical protein